MSQGKICRWFRFEDVSISSEILQQCNNEIIMHRASCIRVHPAYDCHVVSPLRRTCIPAKRNCVASRVWIALDSKQRVSPRRSSLGSPRTAESTLSCGHSTERRQHAGARVIGGKAEPRRGGERRGARRLLLSWRSRVADVATCSLFSRSRCSASRHGYPRWTIRHQVKIISPPPPLAGRRTTSSPAPLCTIRTRTLCDHASLSRWISS